MLENLKQNWIERLQEIKSLRWGDTYVLVVMKVAVPFLSKLIILFKQVEQYEEKRRGTCIINWSFFGFLPIPSFLHPLFPPAPVVIFLFLTFLFFFYPSSSSFFPFILSQIIREIFPCIVEDRSEIRYRAIIDILFISSSLRRMSRDILKVVMHWNGTSCVMIFIFLFIIERLCNSFSIFFFVGFVRRIQGIDRNVYFSPFEKFSRLFGRIGD